MPEQKIQTVATEVAPQIDNSPFFDYRKEAAMAALVLEEFRSGISKEFSFDQTYGLCHTFLDKYLTEVFGHSNDGQLNERDFVLE